VRGRTKTLNAFDEEQRRIVDLPWRLFDKTWLAQLMGVNHDK